MKKAIISVLLAAGMLMSMTGCAFTRYMNKVEEAKNRQAEEEAEQQAIKDAINEAASGKNDSDSGASDSGAFDDEETGHGPAQEDFYFAINLDSADYNGDPVMTENMVAGASIVMINFWEPWCGPCVGELPDLELLYENYKDKGLVIIGAYTSYDMPYEVTALVDDNDISYPVIMATDDTYQYMTEYVPTTCFFDSYGNPLEDSQYIGAHSYEDWASIVEHYLRDMED